MSPKQRISIHSLARRLTANNGFVVSGYNFNSQPRKEADTLQFRCNNFFYISIHSLARRLTMADDEVLIWVQYFNSQPRKEADTNHVVTILHVDISIHSLARRLTLYRYTGTDAYRISIHSLARRLTVIQPWTHGLN